MLVTVCSTSHVFAYVDLSFRLGFSVAPLLLLPTPSRSHLKPISAPTHYGVCGFRGGCSLPLSPGD